MRVDSSPLPAPAPDDEYFSDFFERSVASNGWFLSLTLRQRIAFTSIDQIDEILIHFRHYF